MIVFRMREYKLSTTHDNPNCHTYKIEAVGENLAQLEGTRTDWIYFFVELSAPEAL